MESKVSFRASHLAWHLDAKRLGVSQINLDLYVSPIGLIIHKSYYFVYCVYLSTLPDDAVDLTAKHVAFARIWTCN